MLIVDGQLHLWEKATPSRHVVVAGLALMNAPRCLNVPRGLCFRSEARGTGRGMGLTASR